jgi:hypothetical protein
LSPEIRVPADHRRHDPGHDVPRYLARAGVRVMKAQKLAVYDALGQVEETQPKNRTPSNVRVDAFLVLVVCQVGVGPHLARTRRDRPSVLEVPMSVLGAYASRPGIVTQ